jgi:transcriptional regulator with XRE-family HTH domain
LSDTGKAKGSSSGATAAKRWTRTAEDLDASRLFGKKLRELRKSRNLSLSEAAAQTGIPGATLSRIENNKMVPTFSVLLKIMNSLELNWADIISHGRQGRAAKLLSVSTAETDIVTVRTGRYILPHGETDEFPFLPFIFEVSATKPEDFGGLVGHNGVEFCYVLKGGLTLHLKDRKAVHLKTGQSILFDSRLPHAYTTAGRKPTRLLIVSTRSSGALINGIDPELKKGAARLKR